MSYKDMTFCVSPDCENKCHRKLTKDIIKAADEWWGTPGEAPIAVSTFCGGDLEEGYKKIFGESTNA